MIEGIAIQDVSALHWTTGAYLQDYLALWPDVDPVVSKRIVLDTVAHHRLSRTIRSGQAQQTPLERDWYASLARGKPDYGVYADVRYIGELWVSWLLYSRQYLRDIMKLKATGCFEGVTSIADLGCGLGYSTAALAQLWPQVHVVGTNLEGPQATAARALGTRHRFTVIPALSHAVDLVFASEYFEHFDHPYDHLRAVLEGGHFPRYLILASTFGTPSVGHFNVYYDELDRPLPRRNVGRGFNDRLRRVGYRQVTTGFWNNRPAVWERTYQGGNYASLSTQAPQEATQADSTQALQPAHESATSEEGSS